VSFASYILSPIDLDEFVAPTASDDPPCVALPFDISSHPLSTSYAAKTTIKRLSEDINNYSINQQKNESPSLKVNISLFL
jgi:hypothetical protein